MRAMQAYILCLLLFVCWGCTIQTSSINDPSRDNYNPNYPVRLPKSTELPREYKGKTTVYYSEEFSLFATGSGRARTDPQIWYETVLDDANRGILPAQELLDQEWKHSVKKICDDNLVALGTRIFFSRNGSLVFSEGTFCFYFEDGTNALDRGVRVNMSGERYSTTGTRRSYPRDPLKVSKEQILPDDKCVAVVFLFDREHFGKEVLRVEIVPVQKPLFSQPHT